MNKEIGTVLAREPLSSRSLVQTINYHGNGLESGEDIGSLEDAEWEKNSR